MRLDETCSLCLQKIPFDKVQRHHLTPKSISRARPNQRTATKPMHIFCHRALHTIFTNERLAQFETIRELRKHTLVEEFIAWLDTKPLHFRSEKQGVARDQLPGPIKNIFPKKQPKKKTSDKVGSKYMLREILANKPFKILFERLFEEE